MSQSILNEEDQLLEQPSELDSATSNTSSSTNNKANKASASGHNSVLSESTEKWAKIKQLASRTEGLLTAHQDRLRKTLIAMLRLGQVLQENDLVKGFYSLQSIEYGKKAKINLFHGIVSAAFSWEYPDEKKSKYRQILLYALTSGMSEIEFQERLKADFNNCYAEAVKFLRGDFEWKYDETVDERLDRALKTLSGISIGKAIKIPKDTKLPQVSDGYANAVVRIQNGQVEVVGFARSQSEVAIKSAVSSLVDPEGLRVRRKLTEKPLYWFYTLAEIFDRFVVKHAEADAWDEAIKKLADEDNRLDFDSIDYKELISQIREKTERTKITKDEMVMKRFERLTVLRFRKFDGSWRADTVSTLPSFPSVHFSFDRNDNLLSNESDVYLSDVQARAFKSDFLQYADWSIERNETGHLIKSDVKSVRPKPLLEFITSQHSWRVPATSTSLKAKFSMSRNDLHEIKQWEISHKKKPIDFGRNEPWPNYMDLLIDEDRVFLVFPKNTDFRKKIGTLNSAAKQPTSLDPQNPIAPFRVGTRHMQAIADLAADYSLSFDGAVVLINNKPSALRFTANGFRFEEEELGCELRIMIPLIISNYGAPTEICQFI